MNKIVELFGKATDKRNEDWHKIIVEQVCPFAKKQCYKVRKSAPNTAIGTCTVLYGKTPQPIIICPTRLIERGQIYTDCCHLLTTHEPGNELHLIPEVSIPGGSVDYFLVSVRDGKVKDFVGIEIQTLDTTGSFWPERQRLLKELGIPRDDNAEDSDKPCGINWKMTAKTILVQMLHKARTFEHVHKKLVLIIQEPLLLYMKKEFRFDHLKQIPVQGDSVHLHVYNMKQSTAGVFRLSMHSRLSTDANGVGTCLGLQAEACVEMEQILTVLENKISTITLFCPV